MNKISDIWDKFKEFITVVSEDTLKKFYTQKHPSLDP